jgi:hypothetical protein
MLSFTRKGKNKAKGSQSTQKAEDDLDGKGSNRTESNSNIG